jgi:hypothetical protein
VNLKHLLPFALLCLAAAYPDPKLTPGDILTQDAEVVCKAGYARSMRHVPMKDKLLVRKWYHEPRGRVEIDHRISLCLGGSNSVRNLWPQSYPAAARKDWAEYYLYKQVCAGRMTLPEAQELILNHWEEIYLKNKTAK